MKNYFYEVSKERDAFFKKRIEELINEGCFDRIFESCASTFPLNKVPRAIVNGLFFKRVELETTSLVPFHNVDQINEEIEKPKDEFSLFGCRILVQECVPENTIWLIVPPSPERGSDKPSIKVIKIVENLEVK